MTVEAARPATEADLERLEELAVQASAELGDQRGGALWSVREAGASPPSQRLEVFLHTAGALLLAGTYDDVVVGFAAAELEPLRDGTTLALLRSIYVEPLARGVGVGEALMDAVLAWCEAEHCRGLDSLVLPGNREAKNFFERFGLTARAILVHRALEESAVTAGVDGTEA